MNIKHINTEHFIKIILIFFGIALNMAGVQISTNFNLPFYLDTLGTIIVSGLGGYVPGVIVAFITNNLSGLFIDGIYFYYTILNVTVALIASFLASRGYFNSFVKMIFMIFILTLTNGIMGSIISFLINGYEGTLQFIPYMLDNLYKELLDKCICVTVSFLFLKAIRKYTDQYDLQYRLWNQRPLSNEERQSAYSNYVEGQIPLQRKLFITVTAIISIIAFITAGISYFQYSSETVRNNTQVAIGTAKMAAAVIDGDKVDEYIAQGEKAERYIEIEEQLNTIRLSSDDIQYVYVYKITPECCVVVFDIDTEDTEGGEPGEIVPFDDAFEEYLPDLLAGNRIEPIESDETFGWLLTAYEPVQDSNGITRAYACVDISMERVQIEQIAFLTKLVSLFVSYFITIVVFTMWIAQYSIIIPINTMSIAARQFAINTKESREDSVENFKNLEIKTGDEIENLYDSFSMTIEETVTYLAETQKQAAALSKMQNGLIMVLADMVESRDECTGDHVKKTAAYCRIILEQLRKDGEYKDILNDEYIEDVVNSAPLHDVGKIKVPDAILNKPGKLTDEEFAIMKTHTSAGADIIQQAIEQVATDSGYLQEAKNLAQYHHEKYNGKGYPTGLSGEDIPLSARVMAVADVFDALVSKRSYKEPFSFEEAMKIIEEGSGNHFDPKIVKAFFEAKDQVYEISQKFMK